MEDQKFRETVIRDLSTIKEQLRVREIVQEDHTKHLAEIQSTLDKAKGGWVVLGILSSLVSGLTAWMVSVFKH